MLIDDHDGTDRRDMSKADGSKTTLLYSHLKICRLARTEDGKYSLSSTPTAMLVTDESDASALPALAAQLRAHQSYGASLHCTQLHSNSCLLRLSFSTRRVREGRRGRTWRTRSRVLGPGSFQRKDGDVL